MKLTDVLDKVSVSHLQRGYEATVDMIRLPFLLSPVRMMANSARLDRFEHKAKDTKGNEVAFKEIRSLEKVTSTALSIGTFGDIVIGNIEASDYGFTDMAEVNTNKTVVPAVSFNREVLVCTNVTKPFFFIAGYMYPYPATHSEEGKVLRYDLQTMITEVGADKLTMDDMLGSLSMLKARQYEMEDNRDFASATQYNNTHTFLVNLYNGNVGDITNYLTGAGYVK